MLLSSGNGLFIHLHVWYNETVLSLNCFSKTKQCPFKSLSWMNSSKKNCICDAISDSNAPACVTLALRPCFLLKWIPSSCRCHVQQSYHSQVCCVAFLYLCVCCTCSLKVHGCVSAWVDGCLQVCVCVCVCDGSAPASGLQCWRIQQEKEAVKMDEAAQWRERGGETCSLQDGDADHMQHFRPFAVKRQGHVCRPNQMSSATSRSQRAQIQLGSVCLCSEMSKWYEHVVPWLGCVREALTGRLDESF